MLSVPRAPDAHRLILRALLERFPDAALVGSTTVPWASATFVGTRHEIALRFADPAAADAAAAGLDAIEFTLRRHLVADIVGTVGSVDAAEGPGEDTARLDIAALTVEER